MRHLSALALILIMAACGCAGGKGKTQPVSWPIMEGQKVPVAPGTYLVGKVVRINASARFAVLNFPVGHLPSLDQQLNVYRQGMKVGEIRVTGPQMDDNIVGDIVAGDARAGDEVRDR